MVLLVLQRLLEGDEVEDGVEVEAVGGHEDPEEEVEDDELEEGAQGVHEVGSLAPQQLHLVPGDEGVALDRLAQHYILLLPPLLELAHRELGPLELAQLIEAVGRVEEGDEREQDLEEPDRYLEAGQHFEVVEVVGDAGLLALVEVEPILDRQEPGIEVVEHDGGGVEQVEGHDRAEHRAPVPEQGDHLSGLLGTRPGEAAVDVEDLNLALHSLVDGEERDGDDEGQFLVNRQPLSLGFVQTDVGLAALVGGGLLLSLNLALLNLEVAPRVEHEEAGEEAEDLGEEEQELG
mmetsp:Transcript_18160/g.31049  ORF Transcript_18160/g.31049 Transcript_18160/m.31049 type:complete len:291 (+) Transcript_18160:1164-2036(+)